MPKIPTVYLDFWGLPRTIETMHIELVSIDNTKTMPHAHERHNYVMKLTTMGFLNVFDYPLHVPVPLIVIPLNMRMYN